MRSLSQEEIGAAPMGIDEMMTSGDIIPFI